MGKKVCEDRARLRKIINRFESFPRRRNKDKDVEWEGNFKITEKTLSFVNKYAKDRPTHEDIIAIRMGDGSIIANSAQLPLMVGGHHRIGLPNGDTKVVRFVKYDPNADVKRGGQSTIQNVIENRKSGIPMLPFNAFVEAGLDVKDIKLVASGGAETVNVVKPNPRYGALMKRTLTEKSMYGKWCAKTRRKVTKKGGIYYVENHSVPRTIEGDMHFTGAILVECGGKSFLFDIDRREVEHRVFNPFIAQLPKKVKTIEQAYASLEPSEVKRARTSGKAVLRQGEWFFIPVKMGTEEFDRRCEKYRNENHFWGSRITLQAGNNRPNTADNGFVENGHAIVTGVVHHTGREHADLTLNDYYKAVPNTATASFQVSGDVD